MIIIKVNNTETKDIDIVATSRDFNKWRTISKFRDSKYSFEILAHCDTLEELLTLEEKYKAEYNIIKEASSNKTVEDKERWDPKKKFIKRDNPEWKLAISRSLKGRKLSPEVKARMSEAHKNTFKNMTPEALAERRERMKISARLREQRKREARLEKEKDINVVENKG